MRNYILKKTMKRVFIFIISLFICHVNISYAASESECAIWLCSPANFGPKECAAAHAAMIDRIKNFKPILPPFGECDEDANVDGMTSYQGKATYVEKHNVCIRTMLWGDHGERCIESISIPDHYILNRNAFANWVYYLEIGNNDGRIGVPYFIGKNGNNVAQFPFATDKEAAAYYKTNGSYESMKNALTKYVDILNNSRNSAIQMIK